MHEVKLVMVFQQTFVDEEHYICGKKAGGYYDYDYYVVITLRLFQIHSTHSNPHLHM